jgi:hypothetical protein
MHGAIAEASVYFCKGLSHITEMISTNTGSLHLSPGGSDRGSNRVYAFHCDLHPESEQFLRLCGKLVRVPACGNNRPPLRILDRMDRQGIRSERFHSACRVHQRAAGPTAIATPSVPRISSSEAILCRGVSVRRLQSSHLSRYQYGESHQIRVFSRRAFRTSARFAKLSIGQEQADSSDSFARHGAQVLRWSFQSRILIGLRYERLSGFALRA